MSRQKAIRFHELAQEPAMVQAGSALFGKLKGRWNQTYFKNDQPIVAEFGCGKGEYTVGLADAYPKKNFIGVDLKGPRIYVGLRRAQELELDNTGWLRSEIQNVDMHFAPGELAEIWLTFPDPRPKLSDERRRLTAPRFLALYRSILAPQGIVHLKTDNVGLYQYTLEVLHSIGKTPIHQTSDLYHSPLAHLHLGMQTYFEKKYLALGMPIHYLAFSL